MDTRVGPRTSTRRLATSLGGRIRRVAGRAAPIDPGTALDALDPRLVDELWRLSPADRQCLLLATVGASRTEIARDMNTSPDTVARRVARAQLRLADTGRVPAASLQVGV